MESGTSGPSDAANGTRSRLLREGWGYVEAIPLDEQRPVFYAERQAEQVLRIMRGMADDPSYGFRIDTLRHCLQSATLAHRAGKDEDYVAVAFLHDIGFDIALLTHGAFTAALVGPYVSSGMEWMLANHGDFQAFHFRRHPGIDRLAQGEVARAPGLHDDRRVLRRIRPVRDGPGLRHHADRGVGADGPPPVRPAAAHVRTCLSSVPGKHLTERQYASPAGAIAAPPCPRGTRNRIVSGQCFA